MQAFKKDTVDILPYIQGLRRNGNMSERKNKKSVAQKIVMVITAVIIATGLVGFTATREKSTQHTYDFSGGKITVAYSEAEEFFLKDFERRFSDYELYDSGDLTAEMLETRNGKLIVERCVGIVTDAETGDGTILNSDPDSYYISYSRVDGVKNGTVVVSYMVYSTTDNFIDGIEERFDYVVSREYEQEV